MSLYNMLHGMNPLSRVLLSFLGNPPVGRFRDIWLEDGVIAIYTRNGGGNREHYGDCEAGEECGCTGCIQMHVIPGHPQYIGDTDDDFDCTYCTNRYRWPDEHRDVLAALFALQGEAESPQQKWERVFAAMRAPNYEPPVEVRELIDQVAASLEGQP